MVYLCIRRAISELLSDSTVTENNMMQFLGVIEQRANEIMQRLARLTQDAVGGSTFTAAGGTWSGQ